MLTKEELPECPVATTVRLIGNKWKLLILRNLIYTGVQRLSEFIKRTERGRCSGLRVRICSTARRYTT